MSNQNIQVFVRCRPVTDQDDKCVVEIVPERREVRVLDRNVAYETRNFQFDRVFDGDANQVEVYDTVVKPLIDQVLDGFNCTVFAYGQTGTGKTYTMEGSRSGEEFNWEEDPFSGIIPRAIGQLFNSLTGNNDYTIRVSFIELYNEDTYDLLGPINDTTKLKIYDDAQKKGSVIVGGLQEVRVKSKAEVFELFKLGSTKKQTTATLLNACSSRSHTIFSVIVQTNDRSIDGEDLMKMGKLNLVDLAGSENIRRSGAQDKRAREAGSINQSLLTLGRVITALVEKRPHVPYRESKLTRLLQDSIGGKTKTSIIATISPAYHDLDESLSTLEYASRAKKITNNPEMNQRITTKALAEHLANEIERLKRDYQAGLIEKEYKVRNEVAGEFKLEMEKMMAHHREWREKDQKTHDAQVMDLKEKINRQQEQIDQLKGQNDQNQETIDKQKELLNQQHEKIAQQEEKITHLQEELKKSSHEIKVQKELADYRNEVLTDIQARLQSKEVELRSSKEEIALLKENNDTVEVKKATRVRKAPVLEECGEYANMTFDGNDEITQLSSKKPRKKVVPRAEKRAINQSITCSGKKKKLLKDDIEAELSPIKLESNTRVTRSRATRRKLNF